MSRRHPGTALSDRLPSVAARTTELRARYPRLGRMVLLTHRDSRAVPMQHEVAATPLADLSLLHYDPDRSWIPARLPLPGLYRKVARTAITPLGVEAIQQSVEAGDNRSLAVVWALAGAAMVGVLTDEHREQVLSSNTPHFNMLLGAGPDGLDTAVGLYDSATGQIVTNEQWMAAGSTVALADFHGNELIF